MNRTAKSRSHRGMKFGAAALAVTIAIILSVQFFAPADNGGSQDGGVYDNSAQLLGAPVTIDLSVPGTYDTGGIGFTYDGSGTITFSGTPNGDGYEITKSSAAASPVVLMEFDSVITTVQLNGINNWGGNAELQGNSEITILIAGTNTVAGSILAPTGTAVGIDGTGALTVTAAAGSGSAGIGGAAGEDGGSIAINGGTVTATGGAGTTGVGFTACAGGGGAGIGGGGGDSETAGGNGGEITIAAGATVETAKGGAGGNGSGSGLGSSAVPYPGDISGGGGAGIGGGGGGGNGTVTAINGGVGGSDGTGITIAGIVKNAEGAAGGTDTVQFAYAGAGGAGIGGGGAGGRGGGGDAGTITITGTVGFYSGGVLSGGAVGGTWSSGGLGATDRRGGAAAGIGGGGGSSIFAAGNGGNITIDGGTVNARSVSSYGGAGIGGGMPRGAGTADNGMIEIKNGSTVVARGNGGGGAGIGGGSSGAGTGENGSIIISGSTVTASDTLGGAGIGGGVGGAGTGTGGKIEIISGTVTASGSGGNGGAGIGGGGRAPGTGTDGSIIISGGDINASGNAGIGGGGGTTSGPGTGQGGKIEITGGTVTATATGGNGAGIGGGGGANEVSGATGTGTNGSIIISGSGTTVNATGNGTGAGIGGGGSTNRTGTTTSGAGGNGTGTGGTITINDGTVTAKGGNNGGAGIGGGASGNSVNGNTGNGGSGGNITINDGTVTATGTIGGAGIGGGGSGTPTGTGTGGTGGSGGTITINGGDVNATGGGGGTGNTGGSGIGGGGNNGGTATIITGPDVDFVAYARQTPAATAGALTGFLVNAILDEPLSATDITIYVEYGDMSPAITLTLPGGYRSFAFQLYTDRSASTTYYMYIMEGLNIRHIVHYDACVDDHEVYSIDYSASATYGAHGDTTYPELLLLKLEGQWKVSFDADGGSPTPADQKVSKHAGMVTPPTETVVKPGNTFDGWFYDDIILGMVPWDFSSMIVTKDMTLIAQWTPLSTDVTVTFYDTANGLMDSIILNHGDMITSGDIPTVSPPPNYIAVWYTEIGRVNEWNFSDPVGGDLTLYLSYERDPALWVKVTFYDILDARMDEVYILKDTQLEITDIPGTSPPPGYMPVWYKEPGRVNEWDLDDDVATDLTLYLSYEKDPSLWADVTFYDENDVPLDTVSVMIGAPIPVGDIPPLTIPPGYVAVWYTEDTRDNEWDLSGDDVTGELKLYLDYVKDPTLWADVTFYDEDDDPIDTVSVLIGTPIPAGDIPSLTIPPGYVAVWYTEDTRVNEWALGGNVAADLELYLRFEKDPALWADVTFYNDFDIQMGPTASVPIGAPIPAVNIPVTTPEPGYIAVWYTEIGRVNDWDLIKDVTGDLTLYLSYEKDPALWADVTFYDEFDAQIGPSVSVLIGGTIAAIDRPTPPGYIAVWYTEQTRDNEWDFGDNVTGDLTLYLRFEKDPSLWADVTFYDENDVPLDTVSVLIGALIPVGDIPPLTIPPGYVAVWYTEDTRDNEWDLISEYVMGELKLYLDYVKDPSMWADVTFYDEDDDSMVTISVLIGGPIPAGDIPTTTPPEGYIAVWYTEDTRVNEWTLGDNVTGDLELYLKFERDPSLAEVTFYDEDDDSIITVFVPINGPIPAGDIPSLTIPTGYVAVWYTNPARTTEWDFSDDVTGDLTLYLSYEKDPALWADVTFYDLLDAQIGSTVSVLIGDPIPAVDMPSLTIPPGYIAVWYTEIGRVNEWGLGDNVTGDLTLYLSYEKDPSLWADIAFYDLLDAQIGSTVSVLIGDPIPAADIPVTAPPTGYVAVWYTEIGRVNEWDLSDDVTGDLTLYLRYEKDPSLWADVTFYDEDDGSIITISVLIGDPISPGDIPSTTPPTGYVAVWYTEIGRVNDWDFSDDVTDDLTLYLGYVKDPALWADVKFYDELDGPIETVSVLIGDPISPGDIPSITPPYGYVAVWYTDAARTTEWDPAVPITAAGMELYLDFILDTTAYEITVAELGGTGTVMYTINGGAPTLYTGPFFVFALDEVSFTATGASPEVFELWAIKGSIYETGTTSGHMFPADSTVYVLFYEEGTAGEEYVYITKGDHQYGEILWSVDSSPFLPFPASGTIKVTKGTDITLMGVPDAGYEFFCWYGDISDMVSTYTFGGSESVTVNALFYKDGTEGVDYVVIEVGDCDDGKILWSPDGVNFYPFPATGELNITKGKKIWLKAVPDAGFGFVHWTDDVKYTDPNPYEFDGSGSITVGAVFSEWHKVNVTSGTRATIEYVITVTDPGTGDEFVIATGTYTFGRGGGRTSISVPDGAALKISVISDHGAAAMEWDDGNLLTRQYGPIYAKGVTGDMGIALIIESDDDTSSFPWWTLIFVGLFFLLIFLDDDDEEVYGKVTYKGKGLYAVKIGYTVNGGERKMVMTDKDGDYSIPAEKGDDIVITDISKSKSSITEGLPKEIHIDKDRTKVDFEF